MISDRPSLVINEPIPRYNYRFKFEGTFVSVHIDKLHGGEGLYRDVRSALYAALKELKEAIASHQKAASEVSAKIAEIEGETNG